jgi:Spy/CpxP family protein refolding chaperone
MTNKWLKLLLAASIAFNLAFVAAALFRAEESSTYKRERGMTREANSGNGVHLRSEQKTEIRQIIKKFKLNMLTYKQDILDKRIAIIEALSDSEFNPEEIEKKTGELNQLENRLNLIFVDALVQINNILDSKQRLKFLLKLSKNWFFIKGRPQRPLRSEGGRRD